MHIVDKLFSSLPWVSLGGGCIGLEHKELFMIIIFINKLFSEFTFTVSLAVTALARGDSESESLAVSLVPDHPSASGGIEECEEALGEVDEDPADRLGVDVIFG